MVRFKKAEVEAAHFPVMPDNSRFDMQPQRKKIPFVPPVTTKETWEHALAELYMQPIFLESPMRNRAYRKTRWSSFFVYHTDFITKHTWEVQWPMTSPQSMRAWGQRMMAQAMSGRMPYELRMDPCTGMTPEEAIETADDIESDESLRRQARFTNAMFTD